MRHPLPDNEADRLDRLHGLNLLDTPSDPRFNAFTAHAAARFNVPIAAISLVDRERQWFKASCGISAEQTPRDQAFCAFTIMSDDVFVVEDATLDPRFHDNALVVGPPFIRFYAGAPLLYGERIRLGAICIVDVNPRAMSVRDQRELARLADWVSGEIWALQDCEI